MMGPSASLTNPDAEGEATVLRMVMNAFFHPVKGI